MQTVNKFVVYTVNIVSLCKSSLNFNVRKYKILHRFSFAYLHKWTVQGKTKCIFTVILRENSLLHGLFSCILLTPG